VTALLGNLDDPRRDPPDCGYPGNNPTAFCPLPGHQHRCIIQRGHGFACLCQCGKAYAFPDVATDVGRWQWRGSLVPPQTRAQRRARRDARYPQDTPDAFVERS